MAHKIGVQIFCLFAAVKDLFGSQNWGALISAFFFFLFCLDVEVYWLRGYRVTGFTGGNKRDEMETKETKGGVKKQKLGWV